MVLYKNYSPERYPKCINCDASEVSRYTDIPDDYDEPMGVAVTFLDRYNPDRESVWDGNVCLLSPFPHGGGPE